MIHCDDTMKTILFVTSQTIFYVMFTSIVLSIFFGLCIILSRISSKKYSNLFWHILSLY